MQVLTRNWTRVALAGLTALSLWGWLAMRGPLSASEEKPPAGTSDSDDTKKEPTLKTSEIPASTYVAPQNAQPRELVKFIRKITALRPQFESEADAEKFLTVSRNAVIAAADKLLASKATDEQETEALQSKLQAYQVLLVVGVKDAFPKALKFADQLKQDKRPKLAEMGQAAFVDFKMSTIPTSDAPERRAVVQIVAEQLRRKPKDYYEFATQLGQMLEMLGDGDTASLAYSTFGSILSQNLDGKFREVGEKMKTGAVRRARLLSGDPVKVTGKTLDGKAFDISEYKGKVIVVDFWATWCGPCRAELPNLKAVYDKYHSKGLEVVGVSLDENKEELATFIKNEALPWKVLVSTGPNRAGFENPIADQYGISGIPTVFLINRDGKVVSLFARGEQLGVLVSGLINGQITPNGR